MGPPYGDTLLQLCLVQGRGPRFPSTISFVGDGQFLCPIDGCQIAAKFDDGPTLRLHADDEAGDGSDHTLFFTRGSSAKLIAEVRRAKRATFALEIYDNGEQDISFDVHGLSPTEFPPRAAARKAR